MKHKSLLSRVLSFVFALLLVFDVVPADFINIFADSSIELTVSVGCNGVPVKDAEVVIELVNFVTTTTTTTTTALTTTTTTALTTTTTAAETTTTAVAATTTDVTRMLPYSAASPSEEQTTTTAIVTTLGTTTAAETTTTAEVTTTATSFEAIAPGGKKTFPKTNIEGKSKGQIENTTAKYMIYVSAEGYENDTKEFYFDGSTTEVSVELVAKIKIYGTVGSEALANPFDFDVKITLWDYSKINGDDSAVKNVSVKNGDSASGDFYFYISKGSNYAIVADVVEDGLSDECKTSFISKNIGIYNKQANEDKKHDIDFQLQFKLSASISNGGHCTFNNGHYIFNLSCDYNSKVEINFFPDTGYELVSLTDNGVDVTELVENNKYTVTVDMTRQLTVTFDIKKYKVSYSASATAPNELSQRLENLSGGGKAELYIGSVLQQQLDSNGATVKFNQKYILKIVPDDYFRISSLKIDGDKIKLTADQKLNGYDYSFTAVRDVSVEVQYELIAYKLTFVFDKAKGSAKSYVFVDGEAIETNITDNEVSYFIDKDKISFTATADENYHIGSIEINDTDVPLSDEVNQPKEYIWTQENAAKDYYVSVSFVPDIFSLTVNKTIMDSAGGKILINGTEVTDDQFDDDGSYSANFNYGNSVTVNFVPDKLSDVYAESESAIGEFSTVSSNSSLSFVISSFSQNTAVDVEFSESEAIETPGDEDVVNNLSAKLYIKLLGPIMPLNSISYSYHYMVDDDTNAFVYVISPSWVLGLSASGSYGGMGIDIADTGEFGSSEIYLSKNTVSLTTDMNESPELSNALEMIDSDGGRVYILDYIAASSGSLSSSEGKNSGSYTKHILASGNDSKNIVIFAFDATKPLISASGAGGSQWVCGEDDGNGNRIVSLKIPVSDDGMSLINSLWWSSVGSEEINDKQQLEINSDKTLPQGITFDGYTSKIDYEFTMTVPENTILKSCDISASDNIGNISLSTVNVLIDTAKPVIDKIEITDEQGGTYSVGTWLGDDVKIKISANDLFGESSDTSGLGGIVAATENSLAAATSEGISLVDGEYIYTPQSHGSVYNGIYYFWAYDNAGNYSDVKMLDVKIDKQAPEISEITLVPGESTVVSPDGKWFSGATDIRISANDGNGSGVESVYVSENEDFSDGVFAAKKITGGWSFTADSYGTYYVCAYDMVGNRSEVTSVLVKIDNEPPSLYQSAYSFERKNSSGVSGVLNFLSFGLFANDKVEVTVFANDIGYTSGIKSIDLYLFGSDGSSSVLTNTNVLGQRAKFEISPDFKGIIRAVVTDNVGNVSSVSSSQDVASPSNSTLKNADGIIMLETTPPSAAIKATGSNRCGDWYSGNVDFDIAFADKNGKFNSGLSTVKLVLTGPSTSKTIEKKLNGSLTLDYSIKLSTADLNDGDGRYSVSASVTDNAGNTYSAPTMTVYRDTVSPSVVSFDFSENGIKEGSETDLSVVETDYGFYFPNPTEVCITARDIAETSGIKAYIIYLYNAGTGKYYLVSANGSFSEIGLPSDISVSDAIPVASTAASLTAYSTSEYKFKIPAGFKGQLYAVAIDNVNNRSTSYLSPNSVIVESAASHSEETHIAFSKASTELRDISGNELYGGNVPVSIDIFDSFSGIRSVEWSVSAPYEKQDNQSGSIQIDNSGRISGSVGAWKIVSTEKNLVTKLTGSLNVTNDSNDIVVRVKMTDRSGNVSEESIIFSIDKTAPKLSVSIGPEYTEDEYYTSARTAKITVKERNFSPDDLILHITNTDGFIPRISSFSTAYGDDPDLTVHTATVVFGRDGDYTFDLDYSDNAGNKAENYIGAAFTIDLTAPVISVSYDKEIEEHEGKYFRTDRTATITITEHNFDLDLVNVIITATRADGVSVPVDELEWRTSGNRHFAVVNYSADADYGFEISCRDIAGNSNASVDYGTSDFPTDFTIDRTIDYPSVSGVYDGLTSNGEIAVDISFSDLNVSDFTYSLFRTSRSENEADVTDKFFGVLSKTQFGFAVSIDKIDRIQENDGVYTLKIGVFDKAGNSRESQLSFIVNRFGSVYSYNPYLSSLSGSYTSAVSEKIIITEYNPNRLVEGSLKIEVTRDGKLVEDVSYTVSPDYDKSVPDDEHGWYTYTYSLDAKSFIGDGVYKIKISSEDEAGNHPEIMNYDDGIISFCVDTTPPELESVLGLEKRVIRAKSADVEIGVFDSIGIDTVTVYVDGVNVVSANSLSNIINYDDAFVLSEGYNQEIRIVVSDLAGNVTDTTDDEFAPAYKFNERVTVSTNLLLLIISNPLILGAIISVFVLIVLFIIIKAAKKRKAS